MKFCPCAMHRGFFLIKAGKMVRTTMSYNMDNLTKNQEAKIAAVAGIVEKLKNAQSVVVVEYSGITVEEVTGLRAKFREAGVEYVVLKNKLFARALKEMNIEGLDNILEGPNAFAFGMNDAVAPAKVVYDFIDKSKKECLKVKGGLMGTEVMDVAGVKALSELPSREVLLARLVGSLKSPITNLVYAIEAIRKKAAGEE